VPFAIDVARPIRPLEVYGYQLDTQPLALCVLNSDGTFQDLTFALRRRTHYHLTVDLGNSGVKFLPQNQMLSIAWAHLIRYSVSLIQSNSGLCLSQIEEIPAGKTITYEPLRITRNSRPGPG